MLKAAGRDRISARGSTVVDSRSGTGTIGSVGGRFWFLLGGVGPSEFDSFRGELGCKQFKIFKR